MPEIDFKPDAIPSNKPATTISAAIETADGESDFKGRVKGAAIENPWVEINIGQWPDGHLGHRVAQKNPGSVMVTYARIPREVLKELGLDDRDPLDNIAVSLVEETRLNLSEYGLVLCAPGGFSKDGEGSLAAAIREYQGEVGGDTESLAPIKYNHPEIFDNRNFSDGRNGRGNDFYVAGEIPFDGLKRVDPLAEGLALCAADVHLWVHEHLRGQKGQRTFFVPPAEVLRASPDDFSSTATTAAMLDARRRK